MRPHRNAPARVLLAQWPMSVVMQRRLQRSSRGATYWSAVALLPAGYDFAEALAARAEPGTQLLLTKGLTLELHRDEIDACFANWAAPRPKVFVSWCIEAGPDGDRAVPIQLSVSHCAGATMLDGLDGADGADGIDMPPAVHDWLGTCLAQHRRRRSP